MPTIQIEPEQILNAALQLPRQEFDRFAAKLFALKAREETPNLSEAETGLLLKINQDLPPPARRRMNKLIERRGEGVITPAELEELIRLTDQSEEIGVERLQCLAQLAMLRSVTLDELMRQLGIKPVPHD
ncbi:MAG TPA: STAS/SEC14 domain-containing protein [Blastocatellia bacterium]|nr:STAS/SEC14 domain-containing protein [Blastocatellia bacterium]HMV82597.1 STAS/SEC14 domain-containing protein [Blastocatellia bacterium]HMY75747.1 STAS/SEC14 domain-containing protein [Blastocatellia bacterium]HMZ18650.1 STAS/SEC14 domain-containing protein [Blastocatellia bacterium]HNG34426.1 STAS/SEC14 domain-containing protein [Blastocatellia bacterium]